VPGAHTHAHPDACSHSRCLVGTLCRHEQECQELAITARCLGGKLLGKTRAQTSQPFDNSAVAGGFVPWRAEWGRRAGERDAIRQALQVWMREGGRGMCVRGAASCALRGPPQRLRFLPHRLGFPRFLPHFPSRPV
jgi:hypothetical protein